MKGRDLSATINSQQDSGQKFSVNSGASPKGRPQSDRKCSSEGREERHLDPVFRLAKGQRAVQDGSGVNRWRSTMKEEKGRDGRREAVKVLSCSSSTTSSSLPSGDSMRRHQTRVAPQPSVTQRLSDILRNRSASNPLVLLPFICHSNTA